MDGNTVKGSTDASEPTSRTLSLIATVLLLLSVTPISAHAQTLWSISNTFLDPESAVYDKTRDVIYISNVNQYAKDGNGFISRVSADGKKVELRWLAGLNSPTGIAIHGNTLYVVDYDALVAIDLTQAKITHRYSAPDDKPVLNDVAVTPGGDVFVSGSNSRSIYQLQDGSLKTWVEDKQRLKHANGLLVYGDSLLHGGLVWSAYSLATAELIEPVLNPEESLKDFDGITHDGKGGLYVTLIDDARIWHITNDGESGPLSNEQFNGIDLHFDRESKRLFLPRVGGGLSVIQVD